MKQFEIGKTYYLDLGDANFDVENYRLFKVVKRTKTTVTVESADGDGIVETYRGRIAKYSGSFEILEKFLNRQTLEARDEVTAEFARERYERYFKSAMEALSFDATEEEIKNINPKLAAKSAMRRAKAFFDAVDKS